MKIYTIIILRAINKSNANSYIKIQTKDRREFMNEQNTKI